MSRLSALSVRALGGGTLAPGRLDQNRRIEAIAGKEREGEREERKIGIERKNFMMSERGPTPSQSQQYDKLVLNGNNVSSLEAETLRDTPVWVNQSISLTVHKSADKK